MIGLLLVIAVVGLICGALWLILLDIEKWKRGE